MKIFLQQMFVNGCLLPRDMHTYTQHTHACIHTYMHAYTHIHACTHTYTHIHTYSYAYTLTCIHTHMHTQTCMHVFIHMHMHAHTLSDMHTHIHTASPSVKSKPPPGPRTHVSLLNSKSALRRRDRTQFCFLFVRQPQTHGLLTVASLNEEIQRILHGWTSVNGRIQHWQISLHFLFG